MGVIDKQFVLAVVDGQPETESIRMGAATVTEAAHTWRFFRSGGFDQVRIEHADDLRHLPELDQKLWSVLACPTSGLEFDSRTLALLDADGDGQIRSPEIVAAVRWVCRMLKEPGVLFSDGDALPLDAIDDSHPEGQMLRATMRRILTYLGKREEDPITLADASDHTRLFSADHFNGDGIVAAALGESEADRELIEKIIAHCGSQTDRSGAPGIDEAILNAFFEQAAATVAWWQAAEDGRDDILPLGAETAAAAALFDGVKAKIDDYFTRCQLAAFDPGAIAPLNPQEAVYAAIAGQAMASTDDEIAALPLSRIDASGTLNLIEGINPAWDERITVLGREVIAPILGERDSLTRADWQLLSAKFAAYRAWIVARPVSAVVELDKAYLEGVLNDGSRETLAVLIARDQELDAGAEMVEAVERLLRYRRDLVTLLRNFVSLADFYSARKKAIFQAGTLYLDQRSCELCMRVDNMDKHGALANFSGAYLVYCTCIRKGEAPINIVAAMTGGDADDMMVVGRNGVFYDRQGRDWNATVAKIVTNPISVRQAFWTPYKRIARMVSEQVEKFAAAKDKAIEERSAANVAGSVERLAVGGPAAPAPQAFDIAKFAGIFAAIGLALGALGTALAAVVSGLLSLPLWQFPLVLVGVMLIVSGPSMLLAWLKLGQRNLGPLLDANGWAVNTRARINVPFGGSLTGVARLPKGSVRSLEDPYAEKKTPWKSYLLLILIIVAVLAAWRAGWLDSLIL